MKFIYTQTGETIIYSGRDENAHQSCVAIIMSKEVAPYLDNKQPSGKVEMDMARPCA